MNRTFLNVLINSLVVFSFFQGDWETKTQGTGLACPRERDQQGQALDHLGEFLFSQFSVCTTFNMLLFMWIYYEFNYVAQQFAEE